MTKTQIEQIRKLAETHDFKGVPIPQLCELAINGVDYMRLDRAVKALYFAAYWHADRKVDEAALWTAVRDAASIEPGKTKKLLGPDRTHQPEERARIEGGKALVEALHLLEACRGCDLWYDAWPAFGTGNVVHGVKIEDGPSRSTSIADVVDAFLAKHKSVQPLPQRGEGKS